MGKVFVAYKAKYSFDDFISLARTTSTGSAMDEIKQLEICKADQAASTVFITLPNRSVLRQSQPSSGARIAS